MPEIREKPKMGKPKAKHTTPLSPKQAARVMAEKYRKQTELRAPDEKNATEQATEEITNTADYIANELIESVSPPRRPRSTAFRQRGNPLREKAEQNGSAQGNRHATAQTHPSSKEMAKQYRGDKNGNIQIVHCASNYNNVVITGKEGFVVVGRPVYYTND